MVGKLRTAGRGGACHPESPGPGRHGQVLAPSLPARNSPSHSEPPGAPPAARCGEPATPGDLEPRLWARRRGEDLPGRAEGGSPALGSGRRLAVPAAGGEGAMARSPGRPCALLLLLVSAGSGDVGARRWRRALAGSGPAPRPARSRPCGTRLPGAASLGPAELKGCLGGGGGAGRPGLRESGWVGLSKLPEPVGAL